MMVLLLTSLQGLYGISGVFYAYMTFFFTESAAPVGIALVSTLSSLGEPSVRILWVCLVSASDVCHFRLLIH